MDGAICRKVEILWIFCPAGGFKFWGGVHLVWAFSGFGRREVGGIFEGWENPPTKAQAKR